MKLARMNTGRSIAGLLAISTLAVIGSRGIAAAYPFAILELAHGAKDWDIEAPGLVSIEQAIDSIALTANNRYGIRMEPLADSGFLSLIIDSIPDEDSEKYEAFVEDSGFDPEDQVTGVLFYTDDDLDDIINPAVIIGLSDDVDLPALLEFMDQQAEDEEEEVFAESITVMFLIEQTADEFDSLADLFIEMAGSDYQPVEITKLQDSLVGFQVRDEVMECFYIWPGGVVFLTRDVDTEAPLMSMQETLEAILAELAEASEIELRSMDSELALEAQGFLEGVDFEAELYISTTTLLHLVIELADEAIEQAAQMVAFLPVCQANPEILDSFVPSEYLDLVKMLIDGTKATMDGAELKIEVEVDNDVVEELLGDL